MAVDDLIALIKEKGRVGQGQRVQRREHCMCRIVDKVFGCKVSRKSENVYKGDYFETYQTFCFYLSNVSTARTSKGYID